MFTRLINWLSLNRGWNIIIAIIYYLLLVLSHEWVGEMTVEIFNNKLGLSRDEYNLLIASIGIIDLLLYALVFVLNIRKRASKKMIVFYMLLTIILSIVILQTLFVINIEVVHYVQYAVFSILLFPLIQNYFQTLVWGTIAGSIDEGYQYFYLSPHRTDYYDFNDVLTNLVGAAFGLVLLRAYGLPGGKAGWKPFLQSSACKAFIFILFASIAAYFMGILDFYPPDDDMLKAPYTLVKKMPEGFWSVVPPNVTYHVVLPLEGLTLTILLLLFYIPLGKITAK